MTEQKQQVEQKLWDIANELRGKMGADEFRDYILGFIFYKYLSRKMNLYANRILEPDNIQYKELEAHPKAKEYLEAVRLEALESLGYFLKPSELFSAITKKGNPEGKANFILGDLQKVFTNIEQSTMGAESEEDFQGLFEELDLTSSKLGKTEAQKNELVVKIMYHLNKIDFEVDDTDSDLLGDAYEYLIGQFASGAGKKAGEFYTPQQVSKILAKIVTTGKDKIKNVYDPTCGSGSLLLRVAKEIGQEISYYGQESNPTTYNLCRMNMIMHNVHYRRFNIENEDTLEHPSEKHLDMRFDAIVANPPFSANWKPDPIKETDERFSAYGKLAPKTKADFAFVQHMVHLLDDNGTMACVLPHGVLFRGAAEGHIRKYLIEDCNYLDAVIGLPANIFYGTGIPTCILVLKKSRALSRALSGVEGRSVLFIDASQHFEKVKTQNYLREEDIEKIINLYKKYSEAKDIERSRNDLCVDKYSYLATLDEIRENDYNLNIPRYVDTFEEEEPVDLQAVSQELKALNKEMAETDKEIEKYCNELGIDTPF
ncbi:MAG: type I restriction-modification system subunit M [Crocinitomicaceae bacterium]